MKMFSTLVRQTTNSLNRILLLILRLNSYTFARKSSVHRWMEATFGYPTGELIGRTTEMLYSDGEKYYQAGRHEKHITCAFHAVETQGCEISVSFEEVMLEETDLADKNLEPEKNGKLSIPANRSGIPLEIQNKIFDPYFTTKEKNKGIGLGLALV